ncbi:MULTISPECIES: hypothetical protein [unclassified Haematobacter]|uniref:hypothetical protein n=1 Tax=unclassified Haematobacter TaxID=2640585 RepID=UPI0025C6A27F|nr:MULTISPECIES: hypothetical protein [unclassified Haematobacter]
MVVDLRGIEPGDRLGRKEGGKEIRAGLGQFVEREAAAGDVGKDCHQAGAGRGLQHDIRRRDRRSGDSREAQRKRRAELLKRLAFLGTPCMGRQQTRDFRQRRETRLGRCCFAEQCAAEFAQQEDCGDFTCVIGVFPVPEAGSV